MTRIMRKPFRIGRNEYKFKKDAILHYRTILNAYDFGQSLTDSDFDHLMDLLDYHYFNYLAELEDTENNVVDEVEIEENDDAEITIEDIKIAKVQFNTKCFEVFFNDDTSQYISYLRIINNVSDTPERLFSIACRNSLHDDIRTVKQEYFDKNSVKGQVRCQETDKLSKWTELVVDHRQPNTFSVIVDRFKEVNKIALDLIKYTSNDHNHTIFEDEFLTSQFKKYHMEKANLRIVRTECNSGRTGMARLKRTSKDLIIK